MMGIDEIRQQIIDIVSRTFGIARNDIPTDVAYVPSNIIDGLHMLETFFEVERRFNIQFSDEEAEGIVTVDQLVNAASVKLTLNIVGDGLRTHA